MKKEIPQTKNIKNPEEALNLFKDIEGKLNELKDMGKDGLVAFKIHDKKIKDLWFDKIKPLNLELDPIIDEMITLHKEIQEWQEKGKEFQRREDELNAKKNKIELKRSKFINRVSPLIISSYQSSLNRYQQFGKLAEFQNEEGKPELYVTVHDWLAAWLSGYDQKADEHNKKVVSKVHQKMANTEDAMDEVES